MRAYLIVTGSLFALAAVLHLSRILTHWTAVVAGFAVPQWISWPGVVIAGAMSGWAFGLAARAARPA